jgi:hypothetical protein
MIERINIDIAHKRDVIERPITDELDISGWDLKKALMLLRNSNPPLLEWLSSPIVYFKRNGFPECMRELLTEYYSPVASLHHYLHMARGNHREYLRGETVRVKKYFYVLRPLLAIKWIEADLGPVPMEFGVLVEGLIDDEDLKATIHDLIEKSVFSFSPALQPGGLASQSRTETV